MWRHEYVLEKQWWDYGPNGAVDGWSLYEQFIGVDTKLAICAA